MKAITLPHRIAAAALALLLPIAAVPQNSHAATPRADEVKIAAKLLPVKRARIGLTVGGPVAVVLVRENERVTKGQVLLRLDTAPLQRTFNEARLAVEQARVVALQARVAHASALSALRDAIRRNKRRDTRNKLVVKDTDLFDATLDLTGLQRELDEIRKIEKKLAANDNTPLREFQIPVLNARVAAVRAAIGIENAQAALSRAQDALSDAELRAPFAGTIAQVMPVEGEVVAPGEPLIALADFTRWQLETEDLNERIIGRVTEDMAVSFVIDAFPDKAKQGVIERIRLVGEPKLGDVNYTAVVRIDAPETNWRWNMNATITLPAN